MTPQFFQMLPKKNYLKETLYMVNSFFHPLPGQSEFTQVFRSTHIDYSKNTFFKNNYDSSQHIFLDNRMFLFLFQRHLIIAVFLCTFSTTLPNILYILVKWRLESFIFSKLSLDLCFTVEFRFNIRIVLIRHRIFRILLNQKKKNYKLFFTLNTHPACLNILLSSSSFVQCTRRIRAYKRYLSEHAVLSTRHK